MYRSLHEDSAVADLKDIVNIAQGAASADDYSYSSIAKAASNLTAIFPILVSKTVSGETARIVSKFIEQKACTLFMLGLQQANVDTARDGIAHFKKFHQNLKGSDNRRSAFKPIVDFLKIYTKVTEAANSNEDLECECDSLLETDDIEVNAQALKGLMESLAKAPNIQFYDTQLNPVSINDFGVKETDGNYRVTIRGIDSLHEARSNNNKLTDADIQRAAETFVNKYREGGASHYSDKDGFKRLLKDTDPVLYDRLKTSSSGPSTDRDGQIDAAKQYFQDFPDQLNIVDKIENRRRQEQELELKRGQLNNQITATAIDYQDKMLNYGIKQSQNYRSEEQWKREQDSYRYDLEKIKNAIRQNDLDQENKLKGITDPKEKARIKQYHGEIRTSLRNQKKELETRHKNELDKEELTNDKLRAEIRGADAKQAADIAKARYDTLRTKMDIDTALAQVGGRHAEILKDQDIKKMNDAVPSLLVVKFRRPDSIAYTEYLIGVKAKLLPVTTEEVIRRIINDNKDGKKFLKFMRTITGELRLSNALFALSRMKEDLKSTRVHGTYGDTWNLLKNRAEAARISVKFGQQNDFSAITTVLISKADADDLFRQENIDITKEKETLHFMSSYNLLAFIIVDDATETMKIMFDDGTKQFEEVSYTMLERDSASSYKKVVDLMSTFK